MLPVDLKRPGNRIHETFVALEDFKRASNAPHSQEGRMDSTKHCIGVRQAFPVGEAPGASDAQGIVGSAADRDGIGSLVFIETQCSGGSGSGRIGALGGMIKASSSHGGKLREAALHLVGDCQGGQEVFAAFSGVFACCKDRAQVVTRMAGLPPGKKAVVVVQVAYQGGIVERRPVGSRLAPADQRNERITSKVLEVGSQLCKRWPFK